jgi:NAD(P)H-dependent FMN reductase
MTRPTDARPHLGLVIASTREGRFGPTVARWFAEQVEKAGAFSLDVIDLALIEVPAQPTAGSEPAVSLRERIAAADAIVTPEYTQLPRHTQERHQVVFGLCRTPT